MELLPSRAPPGPLQAPWARVAVADPPVGRFHSQELSHTETDQGRGSGLVSFGLVTQHQGDCLLQCALPSWAPCPSLTHSGHQGVEHTDRLGWGSAQLGNW